MADYRQRVLAFYELFPFEDHPLWRAVIGRKLSISQVLSAEAQHCLRTRTGRQLRQQALTHAKATSPTVFAAILDTYLEECTSEKDGPSHLELIERLLRIGGYSDADIQGTLPTPGNSAAIALYSDIARRGAPCHIIGAGAVEFYYSRLCPRVYDVYVNHYGMTSEQAETYRIHGPMDKIHAERALKILEESIAMLGWPVISQSVRDAFVATSLHYDGMLQAATGQAGYWNGDRE